MWIVKLALRRPYTFTVLALLLLILGPIVILRTPTDVFPEINIPVVSIVWNYSGLSSEDMGSRITTVTERALTTLVDDIEHIESQSLNGIAVVKVFFQPHANIDKAIAQVTAISQTQLRQLPPGTTPPLVITYSASTVPILQLGLSGHELSEQQLFDSGVNFIRTRLITVPGAAIPYPYGGKQRQVQVDLDTQALQAKGLSPLDVVNAVAAQNLILPSGTTKIGPLEYDVDMNASPKTVAELNDLPIRTVGSTTIYIRDVAHVRDGFPPQTNIARVNGQRAVLLTIQKAGNASTLDIISGIKSMLPDVQKTLPADLNIRLLADQSLFVRGSIQGVVREAIIAACLTGFMILVFLGSWRSTVIIAVSIPLSILTSIICLSALGETINIMTLGGLALAVGILVDDATVEIENINRNLAMGKEVEHAILDGAQQIAVPAFVSTLSICIVFVPMFFLTGVARYLFVPLAEAVVICHAGVVFACRERWCRRWRNTCCAATRRKQGMRRPPAGIRSSVCRFALRRLSRDFVNAITGCWKRASSIASFFWPASSRCACCLWSSWFPGLGRIFSREWIAVSSNFTFGPERVRGSKKRRACAIWWSSPFVSRLPPERCRASSTTSGCPTAASTCPTARRRR